MRRFAARNLLEIPLKTITGVLPPLIDKNILAGAVAVAANRDKILTYLAPRDAAPFRVNNSSRAC